MKRKILLIASIVLVLVLVFTLASVVAKTKKEGGIVHLEKLSGYLEGEGARQSFTVYCYADPQTITFTQPDGADFWVKVLGRDDNELGDFQISQGGDIELSGGGRFSLVIRDESGSGAWSAEPVVSD